MNVRIESNNEGKHIRIIQIESCKMVGAVQKVVWSVDFETGTVLTVSEKLHKRIRVNKFLPFDYEKLTGENDEIKSRVRWDY